MTNVAPSSRQPYVGVSAFTHKAGLHASAIRVAPNFYQHAEPSDVGNNMRLLVSELAGRASIELKGGEQRTGPHRHHTSTRRSSGSLPSRTMSRYATTQATAPITRMTTPAADR